MARGLFLCVAAALLVGARAAPKSRFNREISEESLAKQWKKGDKRETDDWHEDDHEWKRKMAQKYHPSEPLEDLLKKAKSPDFKSVMAEREARNGEMHMCFITLRKEAVPTKKDLDMLAAKWQALLKTNSVDTRFYPIGENELLVTEDENRVLDLKDFVLSQPETLKFRFKEVDYEPTPTPKPRAQRPRAKGKSAVGSSGAAKASDASAKTEL